MFGGRGFPGGGYSLRWICTGGLSRLWQYRPEAGVSEVVCLGFSFACREGFPATDVGGEFAVGGGVGLATAFHRIRDDGISENFEDVVEEG